MDPQAQYRSEVETLTQGHAWQRDGRRVVLATVAHTWGSSPRPVGALMALADDGSFIGSVSGGCIEEELIRRVREDFPAAFETIEYESDTTRSLPCGGRLLLTLEPLAAIDDLGGMLEALRRGDAVERRLELADGSARWTVAGGGARSRLEGDELTVVYEPAWRLHVIGAGELARWVCRFAQLLDYDVAVCDPREDYRAGWGSDEVVVAPIYPDDFLAGRICDERTAVVALTHDPKVDDLAIIEALATDAFYVGALGSRRTTEKRAARLREHFALDDAAVGRIHGPVGIDLNTRRPQEIALAVMTDITAVRNGVMIETRRGQP